MAHATEVSGLFPEQCLAAFINIEDWRLRVLLPFEELA